MRKRGIAVLYWVFFASLCMAQRLYPVKVDNQWGLIDNQGHVKVSPQYSAISEFDEKGYAIVQKNLRMGILDTLGRECLPVEYDDIKVIGKNLFSVMIDNQWQVTSKEGNIILTEPYDRIYLESDSILIYQYKGGWGAANIRGQVLLPAQYQSIRFLPRYSAFEVQQNDLLGLTSSSGKMHLPPQADELVWQTDSLLFYKVKNMWGILSLTGKEICPPAYDSYQVLNPHFVQFANEKEAVCLSLTKNKLIRLDSVSQYLPFNKTELLILKNNLLGLISSEGRYLIPAWYQEIYPDHHGFYRLKYKGKWGIMKSDQTPLVPFQYDYIGSFHTQTAVVRLEGEGCGVINLRGELLVPTTYNRIIIGNDHVKAVTQKADGKEETTIYKVSADGKITGEAQFQTFLTIQIGKPQTTGTENEAAGISQQYEWFFDVGVRKWGLRSKLDGVTKIDPLFEFIEEHPTLSLSMVGVNSTSKYDFDRTTFRFERLFGLVDMQSGNLITPLEYWDIRLADLSKDQAVARACLKDGTIYLINRQGKRIAGPYSYVDTISEGVIRIAEGGKLTATMQPSYNLGTLKEFVASLKSPGFMADFTQYDRFFVQSAFISCQDCKWGYLDNQGKKLVPATYELVLPFLHGVGEVKTNGRWGIINREKKVIVPCEYDAIERLQDQGEGIVRLYRQAPKYGIVDTLGKMLIPPQYDDTGLFSENRMAVKRNGVWGFVDANGREIIPCRFREVSPFFENMAAVRIGNAWGFVDTLGHEVIPIQFARVGNFHEGLAEASENGLFGYINTKGQWHIPPQFSRAYSFEGGVARVVDKELYGLIHSDGRFVVRPRYALIESFGQEQVASVLLEPGKYALLTKQGQLITQYFFQEIYPFSEGLAAVKYRDSYGYINTQGQFVIPAQYSKAGLFSQGRAAVQLQGACGYVLKDGNKLTDFVFSRCQDFIGSRAVVYKGMRKAGLLDLDGNLVFEPSINKLIQFNDGRGLVRDDSYRFYFINEDAGWYDGYYEKASAFRHGIAMVRVNGKWGIINKKGIEIVPPKYDFIDTFSEGYAKVRIENFLGLADLKGQVLAEPQFEQIYPAGNGLFRAEQGDKIGYLNAEGKWIWPLTR